MPKKKESILLTKKKMFSGNLASSRSSNSKRGKEKKRNSVRSAVYLMKQGDLDVECTQLPKKGRGKYPSKE